MQLVQFVFSLSLILAAFGGGVYVGWRKWGRAAARPDEVGSLTAFDDSIDLDRNSTPRPDLFAPELAFDLDAEPVEAELDLREREPLSLPAASDGHRR